MQDGSKFYIVDAKGQSFTVNLEIGRDDGSRVGSGILVTPLSTAMVELAGTIDAGEVWKVELTDDGVTRTYGYAILGTETLADIAKALADAVNERARLTEFA